MFTSNLLEKLDLAAWARLPHTTVRNGLVAPWATIPGQDEQFPEGLAAWSGAYSADGKCVESSLLVRNDVQHSFPGEFSPAAHVDGTVIYAGPAFNHFGHFLLESMARLWAADVWRRPRIAWSVVPGQNELAAWQTDLLRHLGLENRVCLIDRPTSFSKVIVPEPGFQISDRFHPRHARFLASRGPIGGGKKKIWLSRSQLPGGPTRVGFEAVEERLPELGWTVVHPQNLSLAEQLDLFASAKRIGGEEGAALHLAVLVRELEGLRMDVLPRRGGAKKVRQNFHLIAKTRGFKMRIRTFRDERILSRSGPLVSKSMGKIEDYLRVLS